MVSDTALEVFVPGHAKPQGSKRHVGRGILIEASADLGAWRERVALAVHSAMNGQPVMAGALAVELEFVLPRPKSAPKRKTPPATRRPDLDKLVRAVLDALTGTAIHDDSLITLIEASKRLAELGETPGARIRVLRDDWP